MARTNACIDHVSYVVGSVGLVVGFRLASSIWLTAFEPSAAVAVAAILTGKAGRLESPAVAVLTGRNVALSTVRRILTT